jgi:hypothetical protein
VTATAGATDTQSKAHRFAADGLASNPDDDVNERRKFEFGSMTKRGRLFNRESNSGHRSLSVCAGFSDKLANS